MLPEQWGLMERRDPRGTRDAEGEPFSSRISVCHGRLRLCGSLQGRGGAFVQALDVSGKRYRVGGQLPLLDQSTPWVSYTSGGPVPFGRGGCRPIAPPDTVSAPDVGMGDPILSADLTLLSAEPGRLGVHVTGRLKLPLAGATSYFYRGDDARQTADGSRRGLALVKRIVEELTAA